MDLALPMLDDDVVGRQACSRRSLARFRTHSLL